MRRTPAWLVAIVTTIVLVVIENIHWFLTRLDAYRALRHQHPWYWAESVDKIGGVLLCFAVVWLLRRGGLRDIGRELGLQAPIVRPVVLAVIASMPMLIGLAIARRFSPSDTFLPLLFMTVFAPIAEEIEYRGFGVRQLELGTGWPFWIVVWPSAILFGWGHVEQGATLPEKLGILALTGGGAIAFSWFVHRWQNLWFAITLHITMNVWWELFSVARSAVGGWFPFALQAATIVVAIVITQKFLTRA